MTSSGKTTLTTAAVLAIVSPAAVSAQTLPDVAPTVSRDDPEYRTTPATLGPIAVSFEGDVRIEYDDNVFAVPDDPVGDAVFVLSTNSGLEYRSGAITVSLDSNLAIRKFADQTNQDSEAVSFEAGLAWSPSEAEALTFSVGWERAIEDRGDPEARRSNLLGPREIDISSVTAGYRRARGKLLLDVQAEATEFDARSSLDDDRDFSVYGGTAKLGLRLNGPVFVTATVFGSQRDFRLAVSPAGVNRDATIYGGRIGFDIAPGGLFEGNASIGVFRNEPDDPAISARTGLSIDGLLIYRPTRRASLIFEASRGDVATFRGGASGRTDTTARFTWEQEIRHNLYSNASVGYRDSEFIDSGISEGTVIGRAEVEYLASRNLSLIGSLSYGSRDSDLLTEEFDRFRGGIAVRFRF